MPVHDDRLLFEFLTLEGAQAGLSWATILRKRPYYRQAFAGFDPAAVARFTAKREAKLLADPGIVRNRLKVASTISNAKAVLAVQDEVGSLDAYLWQFVGGEPRVNRWRSMREVPARTAESDAMSKALAAARLPVRRLDDLLRVHAGRRHGQRPHDRRASGTRHAREPRRPARPHRLAAADPADLRARRRRARRRAGGGARPARRPARVRPRDRAGRLRRHGPGPARARPASASPASATSRRTRTATVRGRRAELARAAASTGIVALGGGSSLDCAKGANFLPGRRRRRSPTSAATAGPRHDAADDRHPDDGGHRQRRAVVRRALGRAHAREDGVRRSRRGVQGRAARPGADASASRRASPPRRATTRSRTRSRRSSRTARTPLSQTFAREAWRLVRGQLGHVLQQPDDLEARGAMLLGSHLAGLAIEHSMLGAGHACANPLTARVRRHARDRGVADAAARRALERGGGRAALRRPAGRARIARSARRRAAGRRAGAGRGDVRLPADAWRRPASARTRCPRSRRRPPRSGPAASTRVR